MIPYSTMQQIIGTLLNGYSNKLLWIMTQVFIWAKLGILSVTYAYNPEDSCPAMMVHLPQPTSYRENQAEEEQQQAARALWPCQAGNRQGAGGQSISALH